MIKKSELSVITSSKKLLSYIITITEKSPIKYRYSFVSKMHNIGLEIIEILYYANSEDLYSENRRMFQGKAKVKLKLLDYISEVSKECKCITMSQYSYISKEIYGTLALLDGWINSDNERKNIKKV